MSALLPAFLIYALLAVAYFGWGRAAAHLLGLKRQEQCSVTSFIWMGWAFTLLIFQIIHLVFPLTAFTVIPVFTAGFALAMPRIIAGYGRFSPPILDAGDSDTIVRHSCWDCYDRVDCFAGDASPLTTTIQGCIISTRFGG